MEPPCCFSCHHFLRLVFPEVVVLVEAAVKHSCAVLGSAGLRGRARSVPVWQRKFICADVSEQEAFSHRR